MMVRTALCWLGFAETTEHSADRGRDHDRGKPKD
jgi:hypothetical protein